ncbi:hypothetical protein GCM10010305_57930 [Streptomyces termitum]|uniref:Uncharacterized protein n=1 Tax=Streptomyces termitum TaxID=67368 RepID=A0A918TAA2_9ACTN|nr:hypothetical protein GCM10010305_57930 [Streptomyces termitum]
MRGCGLPERCRAVREFAPGRVHALPAVGEAPWFDRPGPCGTVRTRFRTAKNNADGGRPAAPRPSATVARIAGAGADPRQDAERGVDGEQRGAPACAEIRTDGNGPSAKASRRRCRGGAAGAG